MTPMQSWLFRLSNWLFLSDLPPNARRTFRFHIAYAMLDGVIGGIVSNAPIMALKAFAAESWQLPMREAYGGLGMLATLYLGSWMASRRKMPFVFVPGMLAGFCTLAMSQSMGNAFWFLTFYGLGSMFEITTRPAVTAILRLNYPVEHRGRATSMARTWSSLSFFASILGSAYWLQHAGDQIHRVIQIQMVCAAGLGLAAFGCFRQIRVKENISEQSKSLRLDFLKNARQILNIVKQDARYRRHLLSCMIDNFSSLLYLPLIWKLLQTLHYDYVGCAVLVHALPAGIAFLTTGFLGRWFDRINPWSSWASVRFLSCLDAFLLAATPFAASICPPMAKAFPILGRVMRGAVQGGWWVLWWQIGITHFAPPGENTSRYMGIMVFLNGMTRLLASLTSMFLLSKCHMPPEILFIVGGCGIFCSGLYSLRQSIREKKEHLPQTFAEFESLYPDNQD